MPLVQTIYLDNNATTRVPEQILAAMAPYYREHFGNPHSAHTPGRRAHEGVEGARRAVASLLDCHPERIIFTSCGTEANALVIRGLLDQHPQRRRIVATAVEHPSVMGLLRALQDQGRIELAVAPVGADGELDLDALAALVNAETLLVSAMLAQNETGVLYPIEKVSAIAHRAGALLHIDAVQAAGKIPISVRALDADFLTISGHKFHAPKGVGALYLRQGLVLRPLWMGGGQEMGMRSGTEAVPSLVGLGEAARLAAENLSRMPEVRRLRDHLEGTLLRELPAVSVNGGTQPRLPNTASISFHDTPADAIVRALDAQGVCVSAGAACHSGRVEPSAVMRAMDKPLEAAIGAVRFSLSRETTAAEIDRAIAATRQVVPALRGQALQSTMV